MRKTVDIVNIPVDSLTMQEALDKLKIFLAEDGVHAIYTPNAEIMMEAQRDMELSSVLKQSDMLVADGAGVVLASKILGVNLPEKVSGIDLVRNSFALEYNRKIKYFIFGAQPGVAETAAENILKKYPNVEICGCRNGYFKKEDENSIIAQINAAQPDILLVGLGAPKQEKWIHGHRNVLKVKVCIGIGGSIDVFAGKVRLAPEFFRRNGLEWLYRLYREPRRFVRMLDLPRFMLLTLAVKLGFKK